MWLINALEGAKSEIIGGIVLLLLPWAYHKFMTLMKEYKRMKQEVGRMRKEITRLGATKEEHEHLTAEIHCKDKTLRQAEAKSQEDLRLIEELRNQIEAQQQELQRKNEALSQTEAKFQEDSRLITELRSQVEALQQEQEQRKAKKKIPPMSDKDFLILCMSGTYFEVEEAIKNGANVNARDKFGDTALYQYMKHPEIANLLRKYGAK